MIKTSFESGSMPRMRLGSKIIVGKAMGLSLMH
jgi:hypothetical protein